VPCAREQNVAIRLQLVSRNEHPVSIGKRMKRAAAAVYKYRACQLTVMYK